MTSDEVTVKTRNDNEYCYRCVPLSQVEQMKEKAIYNLCEKFRWIAAHTLLASMEDPSELKEEIQHALTCTKCPPMDSLSEIEKLKTEITVMVRHRGRDESFEDLARAAKDAESYKQVMMLFPLDSDSEKEECSEDNTQSKFCYRCIPLCFDDRKKENEVKKECVLDLDRYVKRFLSIELSASERFNAQEVFDSAFKCQKCPKIETKSQNDQMWAKIVVMMRRYDRDAALKTVRDANDAAEKQKRIEASFKSAYNEHMHHQKLDSNLPKQPQAAAAEQDVDDGIMRNEVEQSTSK